MRMRSLTLAVLLGVLVPLPGRAAERTVADGGSIQAAIDAALPGDTIAVMAGTFAESENSDRSPRFVDQRRGDFRLRATSPALHAGHPDPAFANHDGTRNTKGHTGGPFAARAASRCTA